MQRTEVPVEVINEVLPTSSERIKEMMEPRPKRPHLHDQFAEV